MFKVLFAKQKKLPWKPKRDRGAKPCLSRFPRELRVRCFARDARPYSTERSAPIPDSNPASRTGRVLSHLSIQLLLYGVNTNFATLIIPLPLLRAYFRSFMGRNQFKKVRSRPPLKKSEAEEVRQGKGGCHSDVRCTPSARHAHFAAHHFRLKCAGDFSCFLSFMSLFRCFLAALHAMHTFFPMTYIYVREFIYFHI